MADEPKIEDLKTLAEINKALENRNNLEKKDIDLLEQRKSIVEDIIDLQKQDIKYAETRKADAGLLLKFEKDEKEQKKLKLDIAEADLEIAKQKLRLLEAQGDKESKELLPAAEETFKKAKEAYDLQKKSLELDEKKIENYKKLKDLGMGLVNNVWNRLVDLGDQFFNEVLQTQQALAKFGKPDLLEAQGYSALNTEFRKFGMGIKEVSEAAMALDKNFAAFQNQSPETQNQLTLMTGKMNNLGISMEETAKNINTFSRGFNMGAMGAKQQLESIALTATKVGMTPQKAFAELNGALDRLSGNGAKTGKIFEELMKKSKELGVEVGTMINIVGTSFDTFEGAADKAGKLNAILGGDFLNSVEMLNATEEERVEILRQSFEQSGKNFEELDRFTKKSIIATMGFKNEAEARMMLGKVSYEERLRMKSEKEAQEQLEKAQRDSVDTTRMMQLAFYDLMREAKPLAEWFRNFIKDLNEGKGVAGFFAKNIELIAGSILLFKAVSATAGILETIRSFRFGFGGAAKAAADAGKGVEKAGEAMGRGVEKFGEGVGKAGQRAAPAIPIILAIGAAIALMGAGIGLAAFGLSYLADSFAKLNTDQIKGFNDALKTLALTFIGFVAIMAILGASGVAEAAAIGIAVIGASLFVLGEAIAIASLSLGYMAGKFAEMFKEITKEKVSLLGDIALGFEKIASSMAWNFIGMAKAVTLMKDLRAAINEIDVNQDFKTRVEVIKTVGETLKTASEIKPDQIKPAKDFIDSSKQYYQAQATSKAADQDALVQALSKIIRPEKTAGTSEADKPVMIQIKLDDGSILTGKGKLFSGGKA